MGTVYVFFADGFEEMEAFAAVDILRRAEVKVSMISVTPDEIVKGAHGVSVLCDQNIANADFYDAEMLVLPGGLPGAQTLNDCEDLQRLLKKQVEDNKNVAAICAAPMVLGNLGLLKGKKATCYPGFDKYLEGAEYTGAMVQVADNFILGKGPAAASAFGFAILEKFAGAEKEKKKKNGMLFAE